MQENPPDWPQTDTHRVEGRREKHKMTRWLTEKRKAKQNKEREPERQEEGHTHTHTNKT